MSEYEQEHVNASITGQRVIDIKENTKAQDNEFLRREKQETKLTPEEKARVLELNETHTVKRLYDWDSMRDIGYGYTEVNDLVLDKDNEVWDDKRLKTLLLRGQFQKDMSRDFPTIVHPFVDDCVDQILREGGERIFELIGEKESHRGFTKHWIFKAKGEEFETTIRHSYRGSDDRVSVGAVLHNGINTGVSLGFDIFTYAFLCGNGAVRKDKNLGTVSIPHAGKSVMKIKEQFIPGIYTAFEIGKKFVQYYQAAAQITVTNEILRKLAEETLIPHKWFKIAPAHTRRVFEVEDVKLSNGKEKEVLYLKHPQDTTLWELYNGLTEPMWHNIESATAFSGTSRRLNSLNQQLVQIVNEHGGPIPS